MSKLKESIKVYSSPFFFIFGYLVFIFSKKNYNFIQQSYVKSYCLTSGFISDIITIIIKIKHKLKFSKKIHTDFQNTIILKENGYLILDNYLEDKCLTNLINLTNILKCSYNRTKNLSEKVIYNENIHTLPTYGYDTFDLIKTNEVRSLIKYFNENKVVNIIENYFGSTPYILDVNMWWSNISKKLDSYSAQDFHFDLDSIKFLKIFIYLKDVSDNEGPHVYVKGTHRTFNKPYKLLKRGYSRISDEEISKYYDDNKIQKITGKKGTIIIGDTTCFHKGLVPTKGNRLIFEITFSNSQYGSKKINNVFLDNYLKNNQLYNL